MRRRIPGLLLFALTLVACHGATRAAAPAVRSVTGVAAVNNTTLWYEIAGQGSPVVLIHGGNLDSRMWDDQFALFARSHRVLRYDVRGFGRSGSLDAPYAAHDDLLALLRYLRIERASLVGLSLGGRIAIDFALEHPEMVDRLVLAGPGLSGWKWTPDPPDSPFRQAAMAALARHDTVGVTQAWLLTEYMSPAMEQPALAARLRTLAAENVAMWKSLLRRGDLEREASPPAAGRLASIRAPTLVIVGSRDTPDILRIVDTIAVTVPGARKVMLAGAGHMVNMEQPDRFSTAVLGFLRGE